MKEIGEIVQLFGKANAQNKKTVLATVVLVEGSSYRRPGARMLVTEDGEIAGTISGGCLETDAIRKSLLAITQQQTKLVAYNSMDDDDFTEGVQLGCNGIVYILFEPVDASQQNNPVALLKKTIEDQHPVAMVTLFDKNNFTGNHPGTVFLFAADLQLYSAQKKILCIELNEDVKNALVHQRTTIKHYPAINTNAFINILKPAIHLLIAGAGNDAFPLVKIANILGWKVTIADGRKTYANMQRFGETAAIKVGKPAEILPQLDIQEHTAVVLLTHNYQYDITMLKLSLQTSCSYIGVLGPKNKMNKMLEELQLQGVFIGDKERRKIYGPVGLDIGTETPEEIALSIIAEIKAVMAQRAGGTLRDKNGFIHDHEKPANTIVSSDDAINQLQDQHPLSSIH